MIYNQNSLDIDLDLDITKVQYEKVDNKSNYSLQFTCDIDTALNLILNIYNSESKQKSFFYNYKNPISFFNNDKYITDCFKLYKNGEEINIWECVARKKC